jgi:molybdopterin converting factor small subunit
MAKERKPSRVMPFIVLTILGLLLGYFGYSSLRSSFISASALKKHTGQILQKGIFTKTSNLVRDSETGARERTEQKFFYLKLEGLDRRLMCYNLNENYKDLEGGLSEGDNIAVLYELPRDSTSDLDIYGIEKNGQIILESSGKRLREKIFGFLAVLASILVFAKAAHLLIKKQ